MSMQVDDPEAYKEFLDTHRPRHQDVDGSDWDAEGTGLKGLFQPIWITIQHLIHLLIWTVEFNTSARRNEKAADGAIQEEEAAAFIRKHSQGDALHRTNTDPAGADWRLAQDKAVFTAAAIKIQLASRAKKAKKKVEERRLKALQVQEVLEGEDDELAEKVETGVCARGGGGCGCGEVAGVAIGFIQSFNVETARERIERIGIEK